MEKVVIGRHSLYSVGQQTFYGSDGLWLPEFNLFGLAASFHEADYYPIAERDVQLAFTIIRQTLQEHPLNRNGLALLYHLLKAVYLGFNQVDLPAHLAGIISQQPDYFKERLDDRSAKPMVRLILLQSQGDRLSLASIGNFPIYKLSADETKRLGGIPWVGEKGVRYQGIADYIVTEPGVSYQAEMPGIYARETELKPDDIIAVCTPYTPILQADPAKLTGEANGDLEAINRHLTEITVKSVSEWSVGEYHASRWPQGLDKLAKYNKAGWSPGEYGVAWAITCLSG